MATLGELFSLPGQEAVRQMESLRDPVQYITVLGAIQIAVCDLWASVGLIPDATLSVSLGDLVAPYGAGALTREETMTALLSVGQRLLHKNERDARLIHIPEGLDRARTLRDGGPQSLRVLGTCSPKSTMLYCLADEAAAAESYLHGQGVAARVVTSRHPWHTTLMVPALAGVESDLAHMRPRRPTVPMFSSLRGRDISADMTFAAGYFHSVPLEPFLFAEATAAALDGGPAALVNVGPDPVGFPWIRETVAVLGADAQLVDSVRHQDPSAAWREGRRAMRRQLRHRPRLNMTNSGTAQDPVSSHS